MQRQQKSGYQKIVQKKSLKKWVPVLYLCILYTVLHLSAIDTRGPDLDVRLRSPSENPRNVAGCWFETCSR